MRDFDLEKDKDVNPGEGNVYLEANQIPAMRSSEDENGTIYDEESGEVQYEDGFHTVQEELDDLRDLVRKETADTNEQFKALSATKIEYKGGASSFEDVVHINYTGALSDDDIKYADASSEHDLDVDSSLTITMTQVGRNLIDRDKMEEGKIKSINATNGLVIDTGTVGTKNKEYWMHTPILPVKPGTTYTISLQANKSYAKEPDCKKNTYRIWLWQLADKSGRVQAMNEKKGKIALMKAEKKGVTEIGRAHV